MGRLTTLCLFCLAISVACSEPPRAGNSASAPARDETTAYYGNPRNTRYPASTWIQPASVSGDVLTIEGFVQVDRNRLFDVRAKEFNGNYFIGSERVGGKIIPVYADYYDRLSKLVGERIRVTAKIRHMKSGDEIQIETLQLMKNTQPSPGN